jgi:hypothetical protein
MLPEQLSKSLLNPFRMLLQIPLETPSKCFSSTSPILLDLCSSTTPLNATQIPLQISLKHIRILLEHLPKFLLKAACNAPQTTLQMLLKHPLILLETPLQMQLQDPSKFSPNANSNASNISSNSPLDAPQICPQDLEYVSKPASMLLKHLTNASLQSAGDWLAVMFGPS